MFLIREKKVKTKEITRCKNTKMCEDKLEGFLHVDRDSCYKRSSN